MKIYEVRERMPRLTADLLDIWEASVRATHHFLSDAEITQINEAESVELLHEWAANWNDVTDFEFIPVISSQEMSDKMAKK